MIKNSKIMEIIVNLKSYNTKFKIGDIVIYKTDPEGREWFIYSYIIDSYDIVKYGVCSRGTNDIAHHYEIELI